MVALFSLVVVGLIVRFLWFIIRLKWLINAWECFQILFLRFGTIPKFDQMLNHWTPLCICKNSGHELTGKVPGEVPGKGS